jgi:hypothetical protein
LWQRLGTASARQGSGKSLDFMDLALVCLVTADG